MNEGQIFLLDKSPPAKELIPARQNNDGQALHSATKTADKKHGGPKQIRMTKIQNSKHVKIL